MLPQSVEATEENTIPYILKVQALDGKVELNIRTRLNVRNALLVMLGFEVTKGEGIIKATQVDEIPDIERLRVIIYMILDNGGRITMNSVLPKKAAPIPDPLAFVIHLEPLGGRGRRPDSPQRPHNPKPIRPAPEPNLRFDRNRPGALHAHPQTHDRDTGPAPLSAGAAKKTRQSKTSRKSC